MIVISAMSNHPNVSLELQHAQADVYVGKGAFDDATAAIERTGLTRDPVPVSSGIKLDPRLAEILDVYVSGAQDGEDRATARLRIEAAIAQGSNAKLSLKGLGLLQVPPVIPDVFSLDLSNNRISDLPQFPCGIQFLILAGNRLQTLRTPFPGEIVVLDVSENDLTALPETLPGTLVRLDVQGNPLAGLPAKLPRELRILNAGRNRADLAQAVADRLTALSARRVYDVATGGPGALAVRTMKKLDGRMCTVNLDAQAVRIPPVEVKA